MILLPLSLLDRHIVYLLVCKESITYELVDQHDCCIEKPVVLDTMTGKKKLAFQYNLGLRESLHISKENLWPGHGLNEDWGGHLYTPVWHPLFQKMN